VRLQVRIPADDLVFVADEKMLPGPVVGKSKLAEDQIGDGPALGVDIREQQQTAL